MQPPRRACSSSHAPSDGIFAATDSCAVSCRLRPTALPLYVSSQHTARACGELPIQRIFSRAARRSAYENNEANLAVHERASALGVKLTAVFPTGSRRTGVRPGASGRGVADFLALQHFTRIRPSLKRLRAATLPVSPSSWSRRLATWAKVTEIPRFLTQHPGCCRVKARAWPTCAANRSLA